MPASVRPMMASRWKHSQPEPVSMIRDISGPRERVRSKYSQISCLSSFFVENPIIAHIKSTSEYKKQRTILKF